MSNFCIPLVEPWNANDFDPVSTFMLSEYSDENPVFVAMQYIWILHQEDANRIRTYVEDFQHVCSNYNFTLQENFRLIFLRSQNAEDLKSELDAKYGYDMVTVVDLYALRSYEYEKSNILPEWNWKSNKSLIMFGKMSREYRCDILRDLIDNDHLVDDKAIWSLEFNHPNTRVMNQINENIDVSKYAHYQRLPDETEYKTYGHQGFLGYPYVKDLYTDTFMSTILETCGVHSKGNDWFLSEKTWRPIANKHPFITICHPDKINFLEKHGISTFKEIYLGSSEYNLDDVVGNFSTYYKRLRSYIKSNTHEIGEIVDQNFNAYQNLVHNDQKKLSWFLDTPALKINKASDKIFPMSAKEAIKDLEFMQFKF